jgi:hypothetical protein
MTADTPIACTLGAGELEQRLNAIAEVGTASLISHQTEGNRHLLRFQSSAAVRKQLEDIVAGERKCCSFLDLVLSEERDELLLSIAAPEDGQAVADELAGAFNGRAA